MPEQRWPIGTTFDPIPPPLDVREVYPGQGMFPEQLPPPVLTEPEPSPHYGYAPMLSRYEKGSVEGTYRQPSWVGRGLAWLLQPLLRREVLEPEQIKEVPKYDEMPYRFNQRTGEAEPYANVQITPGEYGPVEFRSPGEAMLSGIGRLWAFKEAVKNQMRTPEGREQVSQVAQALPETLSGAAQEYMTKQIDMPRRGEQEMWNPQTGEIEDFTAPLVAAELMLGVKEPGSLGMAVRSRDAMVQAPLRSSIEVEAGELPSRGGELPSQRRRPRVVRVHDQVRPESSTDIQFGGWLGRLEKSLIDNGVSRDEARSIIKQFHKYYENQLGTADDPIRMGLWNGTILAPEGTPMRRLLDRRKGERGNNPASWNRLLDVLDEAEDKLGGLINRPLPIRIEFEKLYDDPLGWSETHFTPSQEDLMTSPLFAGSLTPPLITSDLRRLMAEDPKGVELFRQGQKDFPAVQGGVEEDDILPYLKARARMREEGVAEELINVPMPMGVPSLGRGPHASMLDMGKMGTAYNTQQGVPMWGFSPMVPTNYKSPDRSPILEWLTPAMRQEIMDSGLPVQLPGREVIPARNRAVDYRLPSWDELLEGKSPRLRAAWQKDVPVGGFVGRDQFYGDEYMRGLETDPLEFPEMDVDELALWGEEMHILEPNRLGETIARIPPNERRNQNIVDLVARGSHLDPPVLVADAAGYKAALRAFEPRGSERIPNFWWSQGVKEVKDIPRVGDNPHVTWVQITDPKYTELEGISLHHSIFGYTNDPKSVHPRKVATTDERDRMRNPLYGGAMVTFPENVIPGYRAVGGNEALENGVAEVYSLRGKTPEGEITRPQITVEVMNPANLRSSEASPRRADGTFGDARDNKRLVRQISMHGNSQPRLRHVDPLFELFAELDVDPGKVNWSAFGQAAQESGMEASDFHYFRDLYLEFLREGGKTSDYLNQGGGIVALGNRPPRPYSEGGIVTL